MRRRIRRPRDVLGQLLVERGWHAIRPRVWMTPRKIVEQKLQYLAVEMLVNDYYLEESVGYARTIASDNFDGREIKILLGKGNDIYDCEMRADGGSVEWKELESLLPDPPFPMFVVDLSFWRLHSDEEKARLRVQISMALNVVRAYLWDRHLAMTSAQAEVKDSLEQIMGVNKTFITSARPAELLWSLGAENVVILRPDASEELTSGDLENADAFLIGGVVDLTPRKGISRVLDRMVPWGIPKKISLRGSTVGVPDRINRIIEIVLKAMMVYEGDIERAIVSSMTKRDIMRRLFIEIMRRSRNMGGRRVISADEYYDIVKWLPAAWEDFLEASRKAHVRVVGGAGEDSSSGQHGR